MSFDLSAEELFVACWVSSLYFLLCYSLVNYPPLSKFWISFQFAWCCGGSSHYWLVKLHSETCQLERQLSNTQLYQPSRHKRRWNGRVRGNCRMSHTRTIDFSFDAVKVSRLNIQQDSVWRKEPLFKDKLHLLSENQLCLCCTQTHPTHLSNRQQSVFYVQNFSVVLQVHVFALLKTTVQTQLADKLNGNTHKCKGSTL